MSNQSLSNISAETVTDPDLDWWVDGHYISAPTPDDARAAVLSLYGHDAEEVRTWTEDDQADLDAQDQVDDIDALVEQIREQRGDYLEVLEQLADMARNA